MQGAFSAGRRRRAPLPRPLTPSRFARLPLRHNKTLKCTQDEALIADEQERVAAAAAAGNGATAAAAGGSKKTR
jgi:hypothetical protein